MSTKKKAYKQPELPKDPSLESDLPPDADIEERFNDFWKKNGGAIFGGIAIGAVIVIGIQVFQYLGEKKEAAIREAFASATTIETKSAFAEEHPKHQLGGLATLQVADSRYDEGDFTAAAEDYAAAARTFNDPALVSRALMGQGMSLLMSGNIESGRSLLEAVALDSTALDQTRGEAAYHLAVSHWEAGDMEKAQEAVNIVLELDAPFWVYRANLLADRLGLESAAGSAS